MKHKKIICKMDVSREVWNQEWVLREQIREYRKTEEANQYRIRSLCVEQRQPLGEGGNYVLKPVKNIKETNV